MKTPEVLRELARNKLGELSDDAAVDDEAPIDTTNKGVWVQAWIYLYHHEIQ